MAPFDIGHDVIETEHGDVFELSVEGDCSYENIHLLRMKLDRMNQFQMVGVVIDLRKVEIIDSASLGMMIHFRDTAELRGVKAVLCVSEPIFGLLTKTKLARNLCISRDISSALETIRNYAQEQEECSPSRI